MTEWRTDFENAPASTADGDPKDLLLWVADGGFSKTGCYALGQVTVWESLGRRATARGFMGDWEITHWALLTPPEKSS